MASVPLQLPLKASEAATLAGLVLQQTQGRKLDHNLRSRLGARMQALRLVSIAPLAGSVQQDPIHPDTYYVAADTRGDRPECWLLRLALASSPSSGLFPNSILIGRMRTNVGHEVVVNAIRFGPRDRSNIRTFAERVDPAFLPRAQGAAASISVEHANLEASLPQTFEAYRSLLRSTGINFAAVPVDNQTQADVVLWSAIRAGWREGYTLEANLDSQDQAPAGCTKFTAAVSSSFENLDNAYDEIRARAGRTFDLELAFDHESSTPETIGACLRFLKSRGRPAQFIRPHPDALQQLGAIVEVARQHGALLGVRSVTLLPAEVLQQIGRATAGKISYQICGPASDEPARIIGMALENLRA